MMPSREMPVTLTLQATGKLTIHARYHSVIMLILTKTLALTLSSKTLTLNTNLNPKPNLTTNVKH